MKIRDSLKMLSGSITIYFAVATLYACSAAAPPAMDETAGGHDGVGGHGSHGVGGSGGMATGDGGSSGGGPVPPALADPVSGSRLKSKYRTASDGSKQWIGWYDAERNEDCNFLTMSDGSLRCVPSGWANPSGYYADSSCTTQLAFSPGCANVTYAIMNDSDGQCGYRARLFSATPSPSGTMYAKTTSSCIEYAPPPGWIFYRFGPEIQPSAFVSAVDSVE